MSKTKTKWAVVTTEHRGVFFGRVPIDAKCEGELTVLDCRMAVYWSADVKGVVGLAANGPTSGCRITPAAPSMTISDVTSIAVCSDDAVRAWEAEPWK